MLQDLQVQVTDADKEFPLDRENRAKNRDPDIIPGMFTSK
jgi:hypothetical protein